MSKLKDLELCFEKAKETKARFIGVAIETKGTSKPEIIINPSENFDFKLDYYKKAYNEDLILKSYDGIRIVGFEYGNTFGKLKTSLISE